MKAILILLLIAGCSVGDDELLAGGASSGGETGSNALKIQNL